MEHFDVPNAHMWRACMEGKRVTKNDAKLKFAFWATTGIEADIIINADVKTVGPQ